MPKKFQGDESYRLVFPLREAYRLWFSFLKLALDNPELKPLFNKKKYEAWGDIGSVEKFDDWWKDHWRLFAFESGTKVIEDSRHWKSISRDKSKIAVSIPRDQTLAETTRQVEAILKKVGAHKAPRLKKRISGAQFVISATNLKYPSMRLMERIYRLWLKNGGSSELTAQAYFKWAVTRNEQIKKHNKTVSDVRAEKQAIKGHAQDDRAAGRKPSAEKLRWERAVYKLQVRETGWGSKDDEKYDQRRQVIWRYIRKARIIARNTVEGEFPGDFASGRLARA